MCGIVGYIGNKKCLPTLIDGLRKLEYRGYDSAGIAYFLNNEIKITKTVGRINDLDKIVDYNDDASIGIGHTRWATHGEAVSINAHPHKQGKIVLVHNGIIENYLELKNMLIIEGYKFNSETDTEVGAAYVDYLYSKDKDMISVLNKCSKDFIGSFAMTIMVQDEYDKLYVIKKDSPLVIGRGKHTLISSSSNVFDDNIDEYFSLEDFDYGYVTKNEIKIYNSGILQNREFISFDNKEDVISKNGYKHYMLKEINEQGSIINKLNNKYLNNLDELIDLSNFREIHIIGCGSAYHAGIVGKYIIEEYSDIVVNVYIASEYRYQKINYRDNTLVIAISQSGETADTIACLKKAKDRNIYTLGIVNVFDSSIARMVDKVIYTEAGNEIAVATTKGYLTQVYILTLLTLKLIDEKKDIIDDCKRLPGIIDKLIKLDYYDIVKDIYNDKDIFYIGRNTDFASMLEGTLKLKEISYIHAECYAAGEMKHGTISLIEPGTCVMSLITKDDIVGKTISNIKEVKARGAYVVLIIKSGLDNIVSDDVYDKLVIIDKVSDILQPLVNTIPFQLIAYNVALLKNCDIDKPRNLAKSVTVE